MNIKRYTANYSLTNHNFVIQNLKDQKNNNKYYSSFCVIKNIIQRGRPTEMSQFLQKKIGKIYEYEDYKKPFVLIDATEMPVWNHTIKGDDKNEYYPAKDFFENIIFTDLKEYEFISRLIVPEYKISNITQNNVGKFERQEVDFYLPCADLVIEIDGSQHRLSKNIELDKARDRYLAVYGVETVRILTEEIQKKNQNFYKKIELIKKKLQQKEKILDLYRKNYKDPKLYEKSIWKSKLIPAAIIRFQILILELLSSEVISIDDDIWKIDIIVNEIKGYEVLAIEDVFLWLEYLLRLQKINFTKPKIEINYINNKDYAKNDIIVDLSLLKRWTDISDINNDIIYVRTDYHDRYYSKCSQKKIQVNNFRVSTGNKIKYELSLSEESKDYDGLRFFLKNIFNYDDFNQGQYKILVNALSCKDTLGLLPTGGGKSLTYQISCLLQPCINFVVCPIKALMYDQKEDLERATIQHTEVITSDQSGTEKDNVLKKFAEAKYFFIFISPERFQTQKFRIKLSQISRNYNFAYAVIDEVHCTSEWGHDFRTSYLNLGNTIKQFCPSASILGLTATASLNVLKDIQIEYSIEDENVVTLSDYTRKELEFEVISDHGKKYNALIGLLRDKQYNKENITYEDAVLIFTPNVNGPYGCHQLADDLTRTINKKVHFYSGTKPKNYAEKLNFFTYKSNVQTNFKDNKFPILIATKSFGMGINKKNIHCTIHYGIPNSMESLYQEAGRAGRDRKKSKCYVLLSKESHSIEKIFDPNTTYEDIDKLLKKVKFNGADVYRQLFLYQNSLDSISNSFNLISRIHYKYSEPNSKKIVSSHEINSSKEKGDVQKAIYYLSNLGIVNDWTIEDFFRGVYTVYYTDFNDDFIRESLVKFIRRYEDDFDLNENANNLKYAKIFSRNDLSIFQKSVFCLLQWSYDKFAYNRRESLFNIYSNCLNFENTNEGKKRFKRSLEAYFKVDLSTEIIQDIAENNNKFIQRWFSIFYDKKNNFVNEDKLIDLNGNIQRYLESFQNNSGLNLLSSILNILLNSKFDMIQKNRLKKTIKGILMFQIEDIDYIRDQIYEISKKINGNKKKLLLDIVYMLCVNEETVYEYAKKNNDLRIIIGICSDQLDKITKRIENGI